MNELFITSPSFQDGDFIPEKHIGKKGISPAFHIENIPADSQSLVIIMDDLDTPLKKEFTHWIIWNLPPFADIPEGIPEGAIVENLQRAIQGVAYGLNKYKGPKKSLLPIKSHRYVFKFYALDTSLDLIFSAEKHHLIKAMNSHVIATGSILGRYPHKES